MQGWEIQLPSGATVELASGEIDGMQMAGAGERAGKRGREMFEDGFSAAGELLSLVQAGLAESGARYQEAEIEFGVTFKAGVSLAVHGSAEAAFKLKVRWSGTEEHP